MNVNKIWSGIIHLFNNTEGSAAALAHQQVMTMVNDEKPTFQEIVELYDQLTFHYHNRGEDRTVQEFSKWWMPSDPLRGSPVITCYSHMELKEQQEATDWLMDNMPWAFTAGKLHLLLSTMKVPNQSAARPLIDGGIVGLLVTLPHYGTMKLEDLEPYMRSYVKAVKALAPVNR